MIFGSAGEENATMSEKSETNRTPKKMAALTAKAMPYLLLATSILLLANVFLK